MSGARLRYNPALDGFRGIAVMAVLTFHADLPVLQGGFLGVSAFFTLSGYLITQLLLTEWDVSGRIDLRRFWARRLRRLLPAAHAGLVGITVSALLLVAPQDPGQFSGDVLGALFNVANWRFIATGQDYAAIFREASPVQHFWSLAIEEQFYLLHPMWLAVVLRARASPRRNLSAMLVIGIVVSGVLSALLHVPGRPIARAYYGTDTRAAEILIGALLAVRVHGADVRGRAGIVGSGLGALSLCALVASWMWVDSELPGLYRGGFIAHAAVVACLLRVLEVPGPLRAGVGAAPLRAIGKISYGLYIYHWPIYLWLDGVRTGLSPGALFALRLFATFTVATLSYHLVERPVRTGHRLGGRRAPLAAAGAVIGLVSLLGFGRGQWSQDGVWATAETADEDGLDLLEADVPRVLVVGDSLALNIGRGLRAWGSRSGQAAFAVGGVQGCPMAIGGEVLQRAGPVRQDDLACRQRMREWRAFIARNDPDVVVMLTGGLDLFDRRLDAWERFLVPGEAALDDWLVGEYLSLARSLTTDGAELVWLTWPCAAPPPDHGPFARTHALDTVRVRHLNEQILPRVRAEFGGAMQIVDLFGPLCPDGEFHPTLGPIFNARRDGLHLSRAAAYSVARWLGPQILAQRQERRGGAAVR